MGCPMLFLHSASSVSVQPNACRLRRRVHLVNHRAYLHSPASCINSLGSAEDTLYRAHARYISLSSGKYKISGEGVTGT